MTAQELVMEILAGGLLGMIGQGIRAAAGMKKIHDEASSTGRSFGEIFEGSQLAASLMIGFIAGALALFSIGVPDTMLKLDRATIVSIVAAGYSGTDFLEALMKKAAPDTDKLLAAGRKAPLG